MDETAANNESREERGGGRSDDFCPCCFVMKRMQSARRSRSGFFTHFHNARIEMLKAFKSLIDQQITTLEKRGDPPSGERKATRIEVE